MTSNDTQAVIVKDGVDGPKFLVLRRYDREKGQTHYRLVKGGVEPGETSEQAARRETQEETGIKRVTAASFICHYGYQGGAVRHEVDVFLVRVANDVKVMTGSAEEGGNTIFEGIWMAADEAEATLTFKEEKALVPMTLKSI